MRSKLPEKKEGRWKREEGKQEEVEVEAGEKEREGGRERKRKRENMIKNMI